ncbi:MAG TPA: aspartyl protease family protein [Saprospiraceae bacterium]|nr:aspartyl protease family protein [Saprospiraceae bacterium]HMU04518.1 aspartyl protease family protein [Saprospiraceae bacterium]
MTFYKKIAVFCFILFLYLKIQATSIRSFVIPTIQEKSSLIVPFTLNGGLIIIQAKINDSIGNFVIDTGAGGLVLNSQHFKGVRDDSRGYYGLSGRGKALTVSYDNAVKVNDLEFNNVDADVVDLSSIELKKGLKILGLIGFNLLKDYEIMFNYRGRFIALSAVDNKGNVIDPMPYILNKKDSLSFVFGNFIPVIDVTVNGVKKKFGIDSGAEINLLDLKRSKDIMSQFTPIRTISLTGSDGKDSEVIAGRLYRVAILEVYRCATMATVLMNMENLNKIYQSNLDGILGFEFLSPWLFSINYKKQKLYLHQLKVINP